MGTWVVAIACCRASGTHTARCPLPKCAGPAKVILPQTIQSATVLERQVNNVTGLLSTASRVSSCKAHPRVPAAGKPNSGRLWRHPNKQTNKQTNLFF